MRRLVVLSSFCLGVVWNPHVAVHADEALPYIGRQND
jgi:hypothetical protein